MTAFASLTPRPADALLGLMAAFRADPRTDKVDLGVGVYRDESGQTPLMAAVHAAEERLAEKAGTKVYEGPMGNPEFTAGLRSRLLGDSALGEDHLGYATPGGTGALSLAMGLINRVSEAPTIWIGEPTWPNHLHVANSMAIKVERYAYADTSDPAVNLDGMIAALQKASSGDAVLIQGPCHNPTGIDLDADGWRIVGETCAARGLLPLVDCAYHGFAGGLETDAAGIRILLSKVPEALVAYSCSKNFGLYRDRAGCLMVKSESGAVAQTVATHLSDIARALWSMPPAHGPALVAEIFGDPALENQWRTELEEMRQRVCALRAALAAALHPQSNSYDPDVLNRQHGMFSQLPIKAGAADTLKEQGLYLPKSGRINVAGLSTDAIDQVASLLSPYL